MALKDTFCSSPWLHMKIAHDGQYIKCRWANDSVQISDERENIKGTDPITFFQKNMSELRKEMLEGIPQEMCSECYQVDKYQKISGRQRQLLKSGIELDHFEKTTLSSPMLDFFKRSDGSTDLKPIDWQIDLGNYCNSSCVYCHPYSSSTLAAEFKKIGLISEMPPRAWSEDQELVDKFIDALAKTEDLAYLHFLGGETLITPAFKLLLSKLIDANLNGKVSIGFTTNLTVWNDDVISLLEKFQTVNLGMSVECFHPVNDYIRYPSKIDSVKEICLKWIELGKKLGWLMQFRITPTNLSIFHLDTIYKFAHEHLIGVESCNFINDPEFLRPTTLPTEMREVAISRLEDWINNKEINETRIVNTRNPNTIEQQLLQDAKSYVNYLREGEDETRLLPDLIPYLKKLETNRKNSIIDYLPEYEELLRTVGY